MKNHIYQDATSVSVQFLHMPSSENIKEMIEKEISPLNKIISPYSYCKVIIDETQRRSSLGVYEIKVYLTVPSDRVYIAHCKEEGNSHKAIYHAVHDAFDNIRRQLLKVRNKITHNRKLQHAA